MTHASHDGDRTGPAARGRAGATRIILAAGLVAVAVAPSRAPAAAQANRPTPSTGQVWRAQYSDVEVLLDAFERSRGILYARLLGAGPADRTDDRIHDELQRSLRQPGRTATTSFTLPAPADAVFERAYRFRRQIYEILASSQIADRVTAIEQATDEYLRQPELALPAEPKSLELIDSQPWHHGPHVGRQDYPKASGLIRASQWLELALFEPLITYDTPQERRAGVSATVSRFQELLEHPPISMPSETPTAPAIAPGFTQRHPRAAAVIDNAHLLQRVISDILTGERAQVDSGIQSAIDALLSRQQLIVSREDWVLASLRRGIWWQGGPAIGRMDEPERNRRLQHTGHGRMPLPGMGEVPAELRERSEPSQPREHHTSPPATTHGQH